MVGAQNATHMTGAMPQTFANPAFDVARFPVTRPLDQIVAGLNAYQPLVLMGYPSMLALLAAEARADRLRILPRRIITTSEPLLPEVRRALGEAFRAPVANMYGTSEAGPVGVGCFRGPGIHLSDDLVIVEPVDLAGRPVPPGVRSDKLYLTALANPTLPLIRFELTDQVTFLDRPCPCGSAHRLIADVQSRLDDLFTYPGGQVVHPLVFGSPLRRDRASSSTRSARPRPGRGRGRGRPRRPGRPRPGHRRRAGPGWASPTRRSRSPSSTTWNVKPPARSAASSPCRLLAWPAQADRVATGGAAMPDPTLDDQVREFFDRFTAASDGPDVEALGELFGETFLAADPAGARPVPRELFLQALPRRAELFAAAGITRVALDDLRYEALDGTYVLARTGWRGERVDAHGERAAPLRLDSSFLLRRDGDRLRVVLYLNHQDLRAVLSAG
jgi:hypothetical protein